MTRKRHTWSTWLAGITAIWLLAACGGNRQEAVSILPEGTDLQPGDLVFRCGSGMASHAILLADNGGIYTHVGIVADSAGNRVIVHAVPDEPDFKGDQDRVKMESPERFFASTRAVSGEVRRHRDAAAGAAAAAKAVDVYRRHTHFDHDYDDTDTTKMYCSELVCFAYASAGAPITGLKHRKFRLLAETKNCIFPSELLKSTDFHTVVQF